MGSKQGSILDFRFWILDFDADPRRLIIRSLCLAVLTIATLLLSTLTSPVQRSNAQSGEIPPEEQISTQAFGTSAELGTTPGLVYSFSNPTLMTIPIGGPSIPYPTAINVSNIPQRIGKVTVTIHNMNHTSPFDIDVLLVGPQGQTAVIMSDVGGAADLTNTTVTLDDEALVTMPEFSAITSGTYIPTNSVTGGFDSFPAPAPAGASANSALSVFNGTNPNGEWRLFVFDDAGLDGGSINTGWTLTITSAPSGENTGAISIPSSGTASPYPSSINVVDHNNPVSKVLVRLFDFSHSSPDDVDILLVSPSGRSVMLMSDVGGTNSATNLTLMFDDTAGSSLPDSGPITAGVYRPTNFEPGDSFPAPAPVGAPSARLLASLNGTVANGEWKLFVVDDSGNNVGDISGGWSLFVENRTDVISFAGTSVANPYPSEVTVSGVVGHITRITVAIQNFSHTSPDDVDILLVAPDGRKVVLMSDAGGTTEVGALNLTFDDTAEGTVLDNGPITTNVFRPIDYEPGEVYPAPAPSGPPTGTTLGSFFGSSPNGIWRLFVVNDSGAGFGSIAGAWSIAVQTSPTACILSVSPPVQGFPFVGGSGSFNVVQATGCLWTASSTDSFINITSGSSGGGNGTVGFSVARNNGPPRTGTIDVTNGSFTRSFQVQQASGCPFSVNQSTVNFNAVGGTGNVNVTADGGCSWQGSTAATWIQITSQPQTGNGTLVFNIQPNPSRATRSATIDVGIQIITVNQAGVKTAPFDFNGDLRTDVSVFRPSTGVWWISNSGGGTTAQAFGIPTDRIVPADYDGDFKTDIAVYRDGTWFVLKSSDGTFFISGWGVSTDIPVPADYDADGRAELAVFRPSSGEWWILNSNGTFSAVPFGIPTDIPTPGDYDGDGKGDLSVYRAGSSTWWILNSSNSVVAQHVFGEPADIPVPADYDGDGRDNVALFRPSTGVWYLSRNLGDAVQWGISTDRPAAGDYDGDGRADPAVVRFDSSAVWYILGSTSGVQIHTFGIAGDKPAPSAFIP